ncbi:MAG: iron export ABC transporter permease subunit FetB [Firmicutes bacterium]|nr:iron export ABC transporter permease subunit FetB [Bacillota bacterium]
MIETESTALFISLIFIVIAMLLSMHKRLGLEKEILYSTGRAFVQLIAVGYILQYIFASQNRIAIILALLAMTIIAGYHAGQKARGMPRLKVYVTAIIGITSVVVLSLLLLLGVMDFSARFLIPVGSMVIGNSMITSGIVLNRIQQEFSNRQEQLLAALSLGASSRQAAEPLTMASMKAGIVPTLDAMKTMGLVQLPGMMIGALIAGESPMIAVRYQIVVIFAVLSAVVLSGILLSTMIYRLYFTRTHQLKMPLSAPSRLPLSSYSSSRR